MQWYVAMILKINFNVYKFLLCGSLVIRQNYTFGSVHFLKFGEEIKIQTSLNN
jgi:hypothetical protein